jgi:hypothetical protein
MKYIFPFLLLACCNPAKKPVTADPVPLIKSDTLAANRQMIRSASAKIRSGDLVFRTGNDLTSFYFKQLNVSDNTYSHCGIALVQKDQVYIFHALGGSFNPSQRVLFERFEDFISPGANDGFGVFRYAFSPAEQQMVIKTADSIRNAGTVFDMEFELGTNDKMYCAEFIYKTILWGTRGRIKPGTTNPGLKEGVTTDNLFLNPNCSELGRYVFK